MNSYRRHDWSDPKGPGIGPNDPLWAQQGARIGGWLYLTDSEDRWRTLEVPDPDRPGETKRIRQHVQSWWVAIRTCYGNVVMFRKYRWNRQYLYSDSRNAAPAPVVVGMDGTQISYADRGVKSVRRQPRDRAHVLGEIARMCFAGNREVADLFMQSVGL